MIWCNWLIKSLNYKLLFLTIDIWPYSREHALRFSPGFGHSPNPGLAGDSKPRGLRPGGLRQAWLRWMAHSMGYLLATRRGASCQKQGVGVGVLYAHLPLVSLVNFSANKFCYWLCLLSCLGLRECSVLTWPPAGPTAPRWSGHTIGSRNNR